MNHIISCIKSRLYGWSYQYHAWLLHLKESEKKKKKSNTICNIYRAEKKEVFTNKLALTHAYNPLTPLRSSHLQSRIQFSHTISSVTQQLPPVTHLQSHMMLDTQPELILV